MNQKGAKRGRKHTEEEVTPGFKVPGTSKTKEENLKNNKGEVENSESETNGFKDDKVETINGENGDNPAESPKRVIQTRSRCNTPLVKTPENAKSPNSNEAESTEKNEVKTVETDTTADENDVTKDDVVESKEKDEVKLDQVKAAEEESADIKNVENVSKDSSVQEDKTIENGNNSEENSTVALSGSPDMEPLVLEKDEEEAIPELQFDENDLDLESEGSPSRCKTRRSQTRNMSTPKTPKLIVEQEMETRTSYVALERLSDESVSGKSTPKKPTSSNESNIGSESQPDEIIDLDTSDTYSSASTDNISTRAVAGSDATRNADFTYQDSGLFDENSLNSPLTSPNRTLAETLRNLSPRRTIHPISSDYRKLALRNSLDIKGDIYANYESVERVTAGRKRKNHSLTPESKRLKKETPGLFSYIAAPISNLRAPGRSDTPKLIGYENRKGGFDGEDIGKIRVTIDDEDAGDQEKKWCSVM